MSKTRKFMVDSAEVRTDDIEETEDQVIVPSTIAREIVQEYRDADGETYKVLKSAEALDQAEFTAEGAYVTDGHPQMFAVVTEQDQIIGVARNPEYHDDDPRIDAELVFDKGRTPPNVIEEIKDGERTDVSIGFYADEIQDSGMKDGEQYDAVQKNIVVDHVASLKPDSKGRCSAEEGCGLIPNLDEHGQEIEADIALAEGIHDSDSVLETLQEAGFDVSERPCNCGDHDSHIVVDDEGIEEDQEDDVGSNKSGKDGSSNKGNTMENISDLDDNQVEEHPRVQELLDEKEELEDKVDSLEEEIEEFREREAQDLRETLVDNFPVTDEKVQDMDLDDLRMLEDTLEEPETKEDEAEEEDDGDGEGEQDSGDGASSDGEGTVVDTRTNKNQNKESGRDGPLEPSRNRSFDRRNAEA